MIGRQDVSGFMLMRDQDGTVHLEVVADNTDSVSIISVDAFNTDVAGMLDSLMLALDVENSLADTAVETINAVDAEEE